MYKKGFVTVLQLQDTNAKCRNRHLNKKSLMKEVNRKYPTKVSVHTSLLESSNRADMH